MANKKKDRKLKKIKRREYKQKVKQQQLAKSIQLSENDLFKEYYTNEKLSRLEQDRLIVENYKKRNDYIQLVDKQTFMQLEPVLQAEEFIKAYDYVFGGITSAKDIDKLKGKGLDFAIKNIDNYDAVYNVYSNGESIPANKMKDVYSLYEGLKYLSKLTNIGEESRKAFEEREAALNRLLEDKLEYEIFKAYKKGEAIDIDFDKYKSLLFRRVDDIISTMNYSSDQAVNYVLSTDYDVLKGEGGLNIIAKDIHNSKYDSYENRAKEEAQAHKEFMQFRNAQLVKTLNETEEKLKENDLSDVDILRLRPKEFADIYNIVDYNSKNDAKVIRELQAVLEDQENPKVIMDYLVDSLRESTSIVQTNNNPTIQDIRYFIKMIERGIKIDEPEELEFGSNNVNVENKEEEEEYGDIL